MRKYAWPLIISLSFLAAVVVAISQRGQSVELDMEAAELRRISPSIIASGTLEFKDQVRLSPEVIGTVLEIFIEEGDQVRAGQVLLRIDDSILRAEVEQQVAFVRTAEINARRSVEAAELQRLQTDRMLALWQRGFSTAAAVEAAENAITTARLAASADAERLRQSRAALDRARQQLAKTAVRAPADGTVVAINIEVGETAVPSSTGIAGSSLLSIADVNSLIAEINVGEADVAAIAVGQRVDLTISAYPDRTVSGVLREISISPSQAGERGFAGSNAARTYSVEAELADIAGLTLRAGMTVRAEIFGNARNSAVTVPIQAVLYGDAEEDDERDPPRSARREREAYVVVVSEGQAERRRVALGMSDDSHVEITDGLEPGETVATGPYRQLQFVADGDAVGVLDE